MLKSILLTMVILLFIAGLTYSQDIPDDDIFEFATDECTYNPPYNPDWMGTDIQVYNHTGTTNNVTKKTLDMEYCEEDGKLYIALVVNITGYHGARVYSSSNSGLTWTLVGGISNNTYYWTGLSMTVDQSFLNRPDSVRVNLFVTRSTGTNNDNAHLRFYSFRASGGGTIQKTVATPPSGREFAFPSAYSNGQFLSALTDIGCIVGEYNNAGNLCYNLKKFYMLNWSWNFTEFSLALLSSLYYPSAVYKNNASGTDSVYIAVERRISGESQIDLLRTRAWGGGSWPITAITTTGAGVYNRNPCLTIPQNRYPTRMVITYIQNASSTATSGRGRLSYSYSGGASWTNAYLGSSYTTRYTWVASDSNGTVGYCTFIWGDTDSLNVRRANVSCAGLSIYYDRASNNLTGTAFPVCAVYNNSSGNHRRSTFAYWGTGPQDIYFDAENLPIGITNTNGIANTYSLSQNYPNPFNPTTTINFSIPKDGLVKLVVFDVLGKEVATLVNDEQTAGNYEVTFDASKLTSGVYFYKISSGDFSEVKKMLLIK